MFGLPDFAASMDNLVAADNVRIENVHREEIRDSAIKIMVAGGIVLFIGLAVSASAKTSSNVLPSATPKQPIAAQGIAFRSQQINRVAAVIVLGVIALIVVVWFVMSSLPSDPLPSPNMDKSFLR